MLLLASEGADDPELPAPVRRRFHTIRNNVELEARLIDDLLDITRITHGKLSMNTESVDVHAALDEAIATVRSDLDQKQIVLRTDLAPMTPFVRGDQVRLRQVFWNVIKNAVKFTPAQGEIGVMTRTIASGEMSVVISDTGMGMTDRELSQAFEAFTQGEHVAGPGSHKFGGLGLGLAISRKLVELHLGSISATSPGKGCGSTFTISLPLATVLHSREATPTESGACRDLPIGRAAPVQRILLVEDHEPTRNALSQLLQRRKYEVKAAACLAEARELSAQHEFQLLITDIDLPDGTGVELMRELLQRNSNLKGIALTGYGMESDLAKSKAAGFSIHLIKPVRMQSLESALATIAPVVPIADGARDGGSSSLAT